MDPVKNAKNLEDRENFRKFMTGMLSPVEFKKIVTNMDTNHQWSDSSYNIIATNVNCPNDCCYCYMKNLNKRFGREVDGLADIEDIPTRTHAVTKGWQRPRNGPRTYMFPSSHDIFPALLNDYLTVAKKMLTVGHRLIITTKPRLECIKRLCTELSTWKHNIMFMITIGSNDDEVIRWFESQTPLFEERLEALKYIHSKGYKTSVSIEPMLSNPIKYIPMIEEYVTEFIWIGLMNFNGIRDQFDDGQIEYLEEIVAAKKNIKKILEEYLFNDKIMWKESIMQIAFKYFKNEVRLIDINDNGGEEKNEIEVEFSDLE